MLVKNRGTDRVVGGGDGGGGVIQYFLHSLWFILQHIVVYVDHQ